MLLVLSAVTITTFITTLLLFYLLILENFKSNFAKNISIYIILYICIRGAGLREISKLSWIQIDYFNYHNYYYDYCFSFHFHFSFSFSSIANHELIASSSSSLSIKYISISIYCSIEHTYIYILENHSLPGIEASGVFTSSSSSFLQCLYFNFQALFFRPHFLFLMTSSLGHLSPRNSNTKRRLFHLYKQCELNK